MSFAPRTADVPSCRMRNIFTVIRSSLLLGAMLIVRFLGKMEISSFFYIRTRVSLFGVIILMKKFIVINCFISVHTGADRRFFCTIFLFFFSFTKTDGLLVQVFSFDRVLFSFFILQKNSSHRLRDHAGWCEFIYLFFYPYSSQHKLRTPGYACGFRNGVVCSVTLVTLASGCK